ncbi:MAG: hypothetical protein CM15mP53_09680 [Ectothiorhodospiraceae bacterium]|nr:MAG: hypothetical protein CM15mP53_09680 [Ectothiorhodospiraceae bacterium]
MSLKNFLLKKVFSSKTKVTKYREKINIQTQHKEKEI